MSFNLCAPFTPSYVCSCLCTFRFTNLWLRGRPTELLAVMTWTSTVVEATLSSPSLSSKRIEHVALQSWRGIEDRRFILQSLPLRLLTLFRTSLCLSISPCVHPPLYLSCQQNYFLPMCDCFAWYPYPSPVSSHHPFNCRGKNLRDGTLSSGKLHLIDLAGSGSCMCVYVWQWGCLCVLRWCLRAPQLLTLLSFVVIQSNVIEYNVKHIVI